MISESEDGQESSKASIISNKSDGISEFIPQTAKDIPEVVEVQAEDLVELQQPTSSSLIQSMEKVEEVKSSLDPKEEFKND